MCLSPLNLPQARSSFFKSRQFSLEEYEPRTLDITKFVDGFETTKDPALLENFLMQEMEAWRERARSGGGEGAGTTRQGGGAAEVKGGTEEYVSPNGGAGRRLESVSEAKDEAKDESGSKDVGAKE